jgi:hypothetical protein
VQRLRAAQALGTTLLAAHRYAGAEAGDTGPYDAVLPAFRRAERALAGLAGTLADDLGRRWPAGPADDRVWDRVVRMREWCFGDGVALPDRQQEDAR